MGKTRRWFRSLLGYKKSSSESSPAAASRSGKNKKPNWVSVTKSSEKTNNNYGSSRYIANEESYVEGLDANKHAIAVAAATAAVAEAALAAAHAAAAVVRLTSGSRYVSSDQRRELAATKIQSAFRAYLAKRALRALRALVKLQALVRGRIVRKQSADMLRRMQAMARIQARASATRTYSSESSQSSVFRHPSPAAKSNITNHKGGEKTYLTSNWLDRWMEECTWNNQRDVSVKHDEKNDKILEIDTWTKPTRNEKNLRTSQYFSAWNDNNQGCARHSIRYQHPDPSQSSGEASSLRSVKFPPETDHIPVWNYENSPHVYSATSRPGSSSKRGGGFSPSRSEYARSFFGDYLSYPNYMANTESSKAKVRSQSAPKQRLQTEKVNPGKKFVHNVWDGDMCSERDSILQFNYRSRGYSGSDPIQENGGGFSSMYGGRR